MKKINLILFCFLLGVLSCKQTTNNEKEAISLADSAYRLIYTAVDRPESLKKATLFADQSIERDSSKSLAYQLKSTALAMLQTPALAIVPLNDWLNKHPDDSEFLVRRALIYEKLGKSAEAGKDFASISKLLKKRAHEINSEMTEAEIGSSITEAQVYSLINKPDSAALILNKLQKTFPNHQKIKIAATEIIQQDRAKMIYSILGF